MPPALELVSIIKEYHGLRPLRVRRLVVSAGEVVALEGLDAAAAEALTNLVTGATVPEQGTVRVLGADTTSIANADEWLTSLDRFGIVSDRVALVDALTVRQNVAIALTLDLDPLPDEVNARVAALAAEVGLAPGDLDVPAANAAPAARFRARVARAIALSPRVILGEHPTGSLPRVDVPRAALDFFRLVRDRGLAVLLTTADREFSAAADRHLVLDLKSGAVRGRGFRPWFR